MRKKQKEDKKTSRKKGKFNVNAINKETLNKIIKEN